MQPIIYDVAVSLDGYISGPSGDISLFAHDGPVVGDYQSRLSTYSTAIMGRATYEFGYEFGMEPGQNPYPHMNTIVFSQSIKGLQGSDVTVKRSTTVADIVALKKMAKGPIYLCGGGHFAGWFLDQGLIDRVILKRAPCLLGDGVRLFEGTIAPRPLTKTGSKPYENGYLLEEFRI